MRRRKKEIVSRHMSDRPCASGKTILVRGREEGCEASRFPHFPDNRLTYGGEVVSLTRRLPFTPRKIPGTHLLHTDSTPGP
jgi:hypothetical protein